MNQKDQIHLLFPPLVQVVQVAQDFVTNFKEKYLLSEFPESNIIYICNDFT